MKQKKAGICLILLAVLLGIFFIVREMAGRETGAGTETKTDISVEEDISGSGKEESGNPEEIEEKEPEDSDGTEEEDPDISGETGTDMEETAIPEKSEEEIMKETEIKISDMDQRVKKEITDYDAFINAVKEYLFSGAVENGEIISLNSVTTNYDLNTKVFLMAVETEDETWEFYVVQDDQNGTYTASE